MTTETPGPFDPEPGEYVFSALHSDKAPNCHVMLEAEPSSPDSQVRPVRPLVDVCIADFPFLSAVTGWEPLENANIRLVGSDGATASEFARVPYWGVYSGQFEGDEEEYVLTPYVPWPPGSEPPAKQ